MATADRGLARFEWDRGNWPKCGKHGVSRPEIEHVLGQDPAILPDRTGAEAEVRFNAIGRTASGRHVFVVFTIRRREDGAWIRPISARYMHGKEVEAYEGTRRP